MKRVFLLVLSVGILLLGGGGEARAQAAPTVTFSTPSTEVGVGYPVEMTVQVRNQNASAQRAKFEVNYSGSGNVATSALESGLGINLASGTEQDVELTFPAEGEYSVSVIIEARGTGTELERKTLVFSVREPAVALEPLSVSGGALRDVLPRSLKGKQGSRFGFKVLLYGAPPETDMVVQLEYRSAVFSDPNQGWQSWTDVLIETRNDTQGHVIEVVDWPLGRYEVRAQAEGVTSGGIVSAVTVGEREGEGEYGQIHVLPVVSGGDVGLREITNGRLTKRIGETFSFAPGAAYPYRENAGGEYGYLWHWVAAEDRVNGDPHGEDAYGFSPSSGVPSASPGSVTLPTDLEAGEYILSLWVYVREPGGSLTGAAFQDEDGEWRIPLDKRTVVFRVADPLVQMVPDEVAVEPGVPVNYDLTLSGFPAEAEVELNFDPGNGTEETRTVQVDANGATETTFVWQMPTDTPAGRYTAKVQAVIVGDTEEYTANNGITVTSPPCDENGGENCYDPATGFTGRVGEVIPSGSCTDQLEPDTFGPDINGDGVRDPLPLPPVVDGSEPPRRHACFCYRWDLPSGSNRVQWYVTTYEDQVINGFIAKRPVARPVNYCIPLSEPIAGEVAVTGETGVDVVGNFIRLLYVYGASLIGIVSVLVIVISGIQMIVSGAADTSESAKGRIVQALSSLVILFMSGAILRTVNPSFFSAGDNPEIGLDSDQDGMPDWWEQEYGLDPLNPFDAACEPGATSCDELLTDPDGDGESNLGEFERGSSPLFRE